MGLLAVVISIMAAISTTSVSIFLHTTTNLKSHTRLTPGKQLHENEAMFVVISLSLSPSYPEQ